MKILKKGLVFLLLVLVVLLVSGLFINQKYQASASIIVERNASEVYDYVKFLENQKDYSSWAKMDPNMKIKTSGEDATIGCISYWESENKDIGKGEQEIVAMDLNNRIDYELRFMEPFKATDYAYIEFEAIDTTHTQVIWGFDGEMVYPVNILRLFIDFENMITNDLQSSLDNLKEVLEQ